MPQQPLRIGTRASRLARWQANWVAAKLEELGAAVEIVEITTRGDVERKGPIVQIGATGVFTKEIQAAVLEGRVDLAVHSLKDLPTDPIPGLILAAVPKREDVADALVSGGGESLESLPGGATVGTGSQRRRSQLLALRPDLSVVPIRGNVETRLDKSRNGECAAVVLAAAGLVRLGFGDAISDRLEPPRFLPAPGQGALGLECRVEDEATLACVSKLEDPESRAATEAERAMLALLHAGCSAPVGAFAQCDADGLVLAGLVSSLDGTRVLRAERRARLGEAQSLGAAVAEKLTEQGARDIVAEARLG